MWISVTTRPAITNGWLWQQHSFLYDPYSEILGLQIWADFMLYTQRQNWQHKVTLLPEGGASQDLQRMSENADRGAWVA